MNIESILQSCVRLGLPLLIAALGILIGSKSGIILISIEGALELSAFISVYVCYLSGNPFLGQLAGIAASTVYLLLFTFVIIKAKGNQVVCGVGFNFIAVGITSVMLSTLMSAANISPQVAKLPSFDIPLIGQQSINFIYCLLIAPLVWLMLDKTVFGLRIRSIGENPAAADSLGVPVYKYQMLAMIIVGIIGGIAGSELSIGQIGYYTRSLAATKGYMSFSVVILAMYKPKWILIVAPLIGFVDALQMRAQTFFNLPAELFLSIPYALTIIALIVGKNARSPASEGKVFERE